MIFFRELFLLYEEYSSEVAAGLLRLLGAVFALFVLADLLSLAFAAGALSKLFLATSGAFSFFVVLPGVFRSLFKDLGK